LYRRRQFAAAAARFKSLHQSIGPGDFLCEMYQLRCEACQLSPPPDNWDGSYTLSEK
jgi:hypothetical protein